MMDTAVSVPKRIKHKDISGGTICMNKRKLKKRLDRLQHGFLWWKLVLTAPNYFHVSLPVRLKYAFRGFSANEYIWYKLSENDYREYISNYRRTISRDINGKYKVILDDKIIFEDVFKNYVRVSESYAWISDGILYPRNGYDITERNIIDFLRTKRTAVLKREIGAGGSGVFLIRYDDAGFTVNGKPYTEGDLYTFILSGKKEAFLCEYMRQSAFEDSLYRCSTNTIRIICAKKKGEKEARIVSAFQRIGNEKSKPVDNISAGALAAEIDLETGELSSGIMARSHQIDDVYNRYDVHPDSGAKIKGNVIPNWDAVKKEITELTNRFPYLNLVAWDVLLTDEGICIIEGNASSGLVMVQREHGVRNGPIGEVYKSYGL